jgi:hypothetical protein
MAYWKPYFNVYVKKNIDYDLYSDDEKKYIVIKNLKYPLKSNIFQFNNNIAKQLYKLSNNKIMIDNIIANIEYINNGIKIDNNFYKYKGKYLEDINFYPISHFIKIKKLIDQGKYYQVEVTSDIYNEYINTIPSIYINKDKINSDNINDNIYKYLIENKFIGLVS